MSYGVDYGVGRGRHRVFMVLVLSRPKGGDPPTCVLPRCLLGDEK